jgi:hypothetical protein
LGGISENRYLKNIFFAKFKESAQSWLPVTNMIYQQGKVE